MCTNRAGSAYEDTNGKHDSTHTLPNLLIRNPVTMRVQVVDFQWHPSDPFTMVSVSDAGEGGTLQVGYLLTLDTYLNLE